MTRPHPRHRARMSLADRPTGVAGEGDEPPGVRQVVVGRMHRRVDQLGHQRAPVVIACAVAGAPGDPVRAREDRDAVAAGVQNLLLAAHARGLAAIWRTGAMADEPEVRAALGLGEHDALVGMVYVGRPLDGAPPPPPARPHVDAVTDWRGW